MSWPEIELTEEGMREGMQIEGVEISAADKIRLIDALSETGLKRIEVGSFVSPRWTPQMADTDAIVSGFTPKAGVTYTALALNDRGRERATAYQPKITIDEGRPALECHLCDVFVQRNSNRTRADEVASWPAVVERAVKRGATTAGIGVNAAWGSNWVGPFSDQDRMYWLEQQYTLWSEVGLTVSSVFLGDPMSWNMPHVVERQLELLCTTWPQIKEIELHLHNARGMALTSIYAAMRVLDDSYKLRIDTAIGGMGGCPYCGNGRVAGMAPTEDVVQMLQEMGIDLGINLKGLVEVVWMTEEVVGHRLWGRVSKAGPLPSADDLYPMDLPFIETEEQARHFLLGKSTLGESPLSPWSKPIASSQRDAVEQQRCGSPEVKMDGAAS
jgi:hydroxymethylglutaryl-CoA lyase